MFDIWDVIIGHLYQLSVPYVARVVRIESTLATNSRRGDGTQGGY